MSEEEKKNELEKKQTGALTRPGQPKRGLEEPTDREDFIIPRAKLLQLTSPEVAENPQVFIPGSFINSLTKEKLMNDKNELVIIPIIKSTNWARFNPRDPQKPGFDPAFEKGAMIWRSTDPQDPRVVEQAVFGPNGEAPLAIKFLNFLCYIPGQQTPVMVSFSKTSFKAGKELLSMAKFCEGDLFSWRYVLTTTKVTNDQGTYFVIKVTKGAKVEGEEYAFCEGLWEQFHSKDLNVDEGGDEDENAGKTGDAPAGGSQQKAPW